MTEQSETLWLSVTNNTNTIKEIGLFNAASDGTMLYRDVFGTTVVMDGEDYEYLIEIDVAVNDL